MVMKKCFAKILLLAICLFVVSAPLHVYAQNQTANVNDPQQGSSVGSIFNKWRTDVTSSVISTAATYLGNGGGLSGTAAVAMNTGPIKAGLELGGEAIKSVVGQFVRTAGLGFTALAALILMVSGEAFDFVLGATVTGEGVVSLFNIIQPSILLSWTIVRDVSNIIIVFSLLYLAIKTIIDGNGFADKKVLAGVLVAALFINFSLFFTKLVYQVSNEVGTSIVKEIKLGSEGIGSFSTGVMQIFGLQALFVKNIFIDNQDWSGMWNTLNSSILTSLMFIGLSVIFFVFSFVLAKRFFVFVLLMISSPLGLISFFIPWLEGVKKSWWGQLKGQALYLPAFFITLYISMSLMSNIIGSLNPQTIANMSNVNLQTAGTVNSQLGAIAVSGVNVFIYTLFTYILCLGCLLLPILLPNKIASAGAGAMNSFGSWATGKVRAMPGMAGRFAGRTVAGGAARTGRLVGVGASNLFSGGLTIDPAKRKQNLKDLQERARNGDVAAKGRLRIAEGLKNRTYDLRNVGGFGKKMGIGDGIKNWDDAVKAKKEKLEKKQKADMKRYGYDKAGDNPVERQKLEEKTALRDNGIEDVKQKQQAFNAAMTSGNVALQNAARVTLELAKEKLKQAELELGKQKNVGMIKHFEKMEKRWKHKMTPTRYAALVKMKEEMEKKFKEDGKKKKNNGNSGQGGGGAAGGTP